MGCRVMGEMKPVAVVDGRPGIGALTGVSGVVARQVKGLIRPAPPRLIMRTLFPEAKRRQLPERLKSKVC